MSAKPKDHRKALAAYSEGSEAWFPDEDEGWIMGKLDTISITDTDVSMTFTTTAGNAVEFKKTVKELLDSSFTNLPPLQNPPVLDGIDDLAQLSYLHEPAVLHNIKLRYAQESIYTYSGIVLIAMNPFQRVPIYGSDIMREYSGKRRDELEPHLFAVAEEAYRSMINDNKNQSIIVSGESGAGKTQSARYIMRYFATVDDLDEKSSSNDTGAVSAVEQSVLATNPIMESFGNSKTTRNDNSSRFGKYMEIIFSKPDPLGPLPNIVGAKIRTYLLERSRLIFQPANERNYHIFYQLCAGAPAAEKKDLELDSWEKFFYLNQGGAGVIPGVDDAADFADTCKALSAIGISLSTQWDIFKVCAALLHIGNIKIKDGRDDCDIDDKDEALITATTLLGVNKDTFKKWIIKKQINTRSEKIVKNVNAQQATVGRDSVAKFIYSMLFDWIVSAINENLNREGRTKDQRFIGVLDIYGFEHFKVNSFEQFCINYANEKLQQEFNQHVFKLEQEEYVAEEISWSFIDFNDNQPCIAMIEDKLGILSLLDEESRLPSGADESLINKLYTNFDKNKFFEKPRFGQSAFTVKHYATDVTYEIEGFIEKNKDTVTDEQMETLNETTFEFLKNAIKIEEVSEPVQSSAKGPGPRGGNTNKKPTLGSIFKASLVQLMLTIRETEAHYIRCIKPNMAKEAFLFESQMVLQQLRACGVLETIRISCAGYPSRATFDDFVDRYYFLLTSDKWIKDSRKMTDVIVNEIINEEDKYQIGKTKIFFRAGQLAYLEKLRSEKQREAIITVQKTCRMYIARSYYIKIRNAALTIQGIMRGILARKKIQDIRENHAATVIQSIFRMRTLRNKFVAYEKAALAIQFSIRKRNIAAVMRGMQQERIIVNLQRIIRCNLARKEVNKVQNAALLIQGFIRRKEASELLKTLKKESRSVGKLKENQNRLESKVVELSQKLKAKSGESENLQNKITEISQQLSETREKLERATNNNKQSTSVLEEELNSLREEVHKLTQEKKTLTKENTKLSKIVKTYEGQISSLEKQKSVNENLIGELRTSRTTSPVNGIPTSGRTSNVEDQQLVAELRKEISQLREQLYAGKYKSDVIAHQKITNVSSPTRQKPDFTIGTAQNRSAVTSGNLASQIENDIAAASARVVKRPGDYGTIHGMGTLAGPRGSNTGIENGGTIRGMGTLRGRPGEPNMGTANNYAELAGQQISETALVALLRDPRLEDELVENLITGLSVKRPTAQSIASRKEILFPAHIMGCIVMHLVNHNLPGRLLQVMGSVMQAIQNITMKFEDDYVSAFWLSNCYELICVVKTAQDSENRRMAMNKERNDSSDVENALDKIHNDLDYLLVEIYNGWLREMKRRLNAMIVPAVIENQSLSGYICNQSNGIWGKWSKSASPQFTIDQLLNLLSKLSKTMRCYYLEESLMRQVLTELVRVIGVNSFNHLLVRKNFCTWKRGVQIQFNVTRLEEWCNNHSISEATLHLKQIQQAAKLLTLNKTSPQDIDTIVDACFLLNSAQIKKILSLYHAGDFDSPLSPDLLKLVSSRAVTNESSDNLLLDLDSAPDFVKPSFKLVANIDRFIPNHVNLPQVSVVAAQSFSGKRIAN